MPRPSIEQIRSVGDFATIYQWNLNFLSFPSALLAGSFPSSRALNLRCESTGLPTKPNEKIEVNIRGQKIYQAGQAAYNAEITMTFIETVDSRIANFILAWHEACVTTNTGIHASNADAECNIQIQRLNRQDQAIWVYTLIGCKLVSYEHPDVGTDNDTWKPTITIGFDYFTEQALGAAAAISTLGGIGGLAGNIAGLFGL